MTIQNNTPAQTLTPESQGAAELISNRWLAALGKFLNDDEIEITKKYLDDSTTGEIVAIATILRVMAETTREHAADLFADGAQLRGEDADDRADGYQKAYNAILSIYN